MNRLWILLLPFILLAQGPTQISPGIAKMPSKVFPPSIADYVEDWSAPTAIYAFNAHNDSLLVGDVVVWKDDLTMIDSLRCDGTGNDTLTLDDSLATYRWWQLRAKTINAASACSLRITGKDSLNAVQYDTVVLNGSGGVVKYSTKFWREIDVAYFKHHAANDTFTVYAIPYCAVDTTVTAADPTVAGVVLENAATDKKVKICISGYCKAKLIGATTEVIPGMYVETSATAHYGRVNATPAAGKGFGKTASSGNTNTTYWVKVSPAY